MSEVLNAADAAERPPLTIIIAIIVAAWSDPCQSSIVAKAKTSDCSAALVAGKSGLVLS